MEYLVLVKLVLAIVLLLVLVIRKVKPEIAMVAAGLFLMIICLQKPADYLAVGKAFVTNTSVYTTGLTILGISILSNVMGKSGMMTKMVTNLEEAVNNKKLTLMITPFLIGLLAVVGGAFISCPLVDEISKDLDIKQERKAAINLAFRHCLHLMYPMSNVVYLTVALVGCTTGDLLKLTAPLAIANAVICYLLFIRDIKLPPKEKDPNVNRWKSFLLFLLNVAPIVVALVLTVAFKVLMPISLLVAVVLAVVIANLQSDTKPKGNYLEFLFKGVKISTILVVLAALLLKEVISSIEAINVALTGLANLGMPVEIILFIMCLLTALPTGNAATSIAVATPIAISFSTSLAQSTLFAALVMGLSYVSYYFSPVHMCQLLTIEYFKTDVGSLMKEYRFYIPLYFVLVWAWYFVVRLVFPV